MSFASATCQLPYQNCTVCPFVPIAAWHADPGLTAGATLPAVLWPVLLLLRHPLCSLRGPDVQGCLAP